MSKTAKTWLFIATVLVVLGLILFTGVMIAYDWDFTKLSTVTYVTNTYEVSGTFDKISIDVDTTEIEFVSTEEEDCSIVCYEADKVKHYATIQNRTLMISIVDTRKWYDHIGISIGTPKMTVYLPQNEYVSLSIETDTGDITVPKEFSFEILEIDGDTSDVDCYATVSNDLDISLSTGSIKIDSISAGRMDLSTSTGKIRINSVTVDETIDIETDTGSVSLSDVTCTDFAAEGDTGTITLENVVASGKFMINNDTGDVRFDNSDASQITVKTNTGDVTGSLLTEKIFVTETSTGKIDVPKATSGGKCEIRTSTGDVEITID